GATTSPPSCLTGDAYFPGSSFAPVLGPGSELGIGLVRTACSPYEAHTEQYVSGGVVTGGVTVGYGTSGHLGSSDRTLGAVSVDDCPFLGFLGNSGVSAAMNDQDGSLFVSGVIVSCEEAYSFAANTTDTGLWVSQPGEAIDQPNVQLVAFSGDA